MAIYQHETMFAGKKVVEWQPELQLSSPESQVYRITLSYEEGDGGMLWTDKFNKFLSEPEVGKITALIVGCWSDDSSESSEAVVEALVSAREKLPLLKSLFFGDIVVDENEISWIIQSDVSPIFSAYPALEEFVVRGGNELRFGNLKHQHLRSLIVQTGGLDAIAVNQIAKAELPALEHLEIWLGSDDYGGNSSVDDLLPLLSGDLFPKLQYLGLRNCEYVNDIAAALTHSPILNRISVLDLSLGTLSDRGAKALLACSALKHLKKLDLHHHFCSEEFKTKFEALGDDLGIEVIIGDAEEPWEDSDDEENDEPEGRYVAVSE